MFSKLERDVFVLFFPDIHMTWCSQFLLVLQAFSCKKIIINNNKKVWALVFYSFGATCLLVLKTKLARKNKYFVPGLYYFYNKIFKFLNSVRITMDERNMEEKSVKGTVTPLKINPWDGNRESRNAKTQTPF